MLLAARATAASAPASDSVVISQGTDIDTLNPIKTGGTITHIVLDQLFDTLIWTDDEGHYRPSLATSWRQVSPSVWEFKLRHDVHFWNGDPLTSADVKFTIDKLKDPSFSTFQAIYAETVDHVDAPDPYTVRYVMKHPGWIMPGSPYYVQIVDAKYWLAHGEAYMNEHPMGSGPYVFRSWKKDEEVAFDANPSYWGGKPAIAHVFFRPITEISSRVAALKTGETDVITGVPYQNALSIEGSLKTKMLSARSTRLLFLAFNLRVPGDVQNIKVRQAIASAIDVTPIINTVLGGRAFPVAGPFLPGMIGFDPNLQPYRFDPGHAKELLASAGYTPAKPLSITINTPVGRYARDSEITQAVAGQLSAVGINATVKTWDSTNWAAAMRRHELAPMTIVGIGNRSGAGDDTLNEVLSSKALYSLYANDTLDKMAEQARYELDPRTRQKEYVQIQAFIHREIPAVFLLQYEDLYGSARALQWHARSDERLFVHTWSWQQ